MFVKKTLDKSAVRCYNNYILLKAVTERLFYKRLREKAVGASLGVSLKAAAPEYLYESTNVSCVKGFE